MSKTNRKEYTGSKRFDKTCRNQGTCNTCQENRQHKNSKKLTLKQSIKQMRDEIQEHKEY
jgi:hypothetical protein